MAKRQKTGGRVAGTPNRATVLRLIETSGTPLPSFASRLPVPAIASLLATTPKRRTHAGRPNADREAKSPDPTPPMAQTLDRLVSVLELLAPLLAKLVTVRWPDDPPPARFDPPI